jgi:TolB-like protein
LFAVLKGSVEKTGDQCKTLVKLVSASGDHQFWAGLYYHDPQGVDGIQ